MAKEVALTQNYAAIVDDEDYERVIQYNWHCAKRLTTIYAGSRIRDVDKKETYVLMHRFIMNAPKGVEVDHINGNGLDNQSHNLRFATHQENTRNQHRKRGFKGIAEQSFNQYRKRFWSSINVGKARITLGFYDNEMAAACAYDYAAVEYFGEFACLNFPNGQPLTREELKNHEYNKHHAASAYRGVYFYKKKWKAQTSLKGKTIYIGTFHSEIEAAKAYNEVAFSVHGDNAILNIFDE